MSFTLATILSNRTAINIMMIVFNLNSFYEQYTFFYATSSVIQSTTRPLIEFQLVDYYCAQLFRLLYERFWFFVDAI